MYQEWHFYGFQFTPRDGHAFPSRRMNDQQLQFRFLSHPKSAFMAGHWGFLETIVTKFGSMLVSFMELKKSDRRFTIVTKRKKTASIQLRKIKKLLSDVWPATSIALPP